jgi:GT2 family glycosyltransferase
MTTRPLDVVVVAYGWDDNLVRALDAVAHLHVIVIDNSCEDSVREHAVHAGFDYDAPGSNLGFAGGVNRGLRRVAPGHDVLLLNPDAEISADSIEAMRQALERPGIAAVAPQLKDSDGFDTRVVWPFPTPLRAWRQAFGLGDGPAQGGYVIGAVLLLAREALDDVGGLDERFFLYAEETDWQRRAHEKGWRSVVCPGAEAAHVGAGTSSDVAVREAFFHAGSETYIRKWYGSFGWVTFRVARVAGALARSVLRPRQRGEHLARAKLYLRGPRRAAGLEP